jgi:lipid II:glycine glycyltransferase (peptidoglycan interpeptide bridge formation enzyme)
VVLDDLAALPLVRVGIRPNPLHHAAWAAGCPDGYRTIDRRAHAIDLRDGFDAVWQRFSSRARNHVRRAERAEVEVEVDTAGDLLPVFHELFMRSVDRWAAKQHEPRLLARWRAVRRDSVAKMGHVVRDLDGASRLWVAWVGGRPAAAILVLRGANAHYTRGAMDAELAGPARANYLLHRLAIEDACSAGCSTYHMGETGSSRSLAQFKEALGARAHDYADYLTERLPLTTTDRAVRTAVKRALRFRDDG